MLSSQNRNNFFITVPREIFDGEDCHNDQKISDPKHRERHGCNQHNNCRNKKNESKHDGRHGCNQCNNHWSSRHN